MALNPFEQLEFLLPAPHRAFGNVVDGLVRDRLGMGVLRTSAAEGKTYVRRGNELTLYQAKYFVGRWESRQRREIRNALQQSLREVSPSHRWVLCTPTRTTAEDLCWFSEWRTKQPIEIELADGNELSKWLRESSGRSALERLRTFGATVPGGEPARVQGHLRIHPAGAQSELTHYLYISVCHLGGDSAARGLRVELAHSATGCFTLHHDEGQWSDEGKGRLNPRALRARKALLPDEERLVAVIPIGYRTPWPLTLRLKLSTAETASMEQRLSMDLDDLKIIQQFDFVTGSPAELVAGDVTSIQAAVG